MYLHLLALPRHGASPPLTKAEVRVVFGPDGSPTVCGRGRRLRVQPANSPATSVVGRYTANPPCVSAESAGVPNAAVRRFSRPGGYLVYLVLSEDIVQPAMFWGPLVAGAARARRRPAHSFPVKKQQNISVIKLADWATSVAPVDDYAGSMMI